MRNDIDSRKAEIIVWIGEKLPKAEICRRLACKPITLETRLSKWGLSYKGNKGAEGHKASNQRKTAAEYASNPYAKSHKLKLKLIEDGVKLDCCERCDLVEWLGRPIPLELHHKDGDHFNNELSNLELLCPNCHALEPNNSGAGRKKMAR